MTDIAITAPRRPGRHIKFLKSLALLRESPIGMFGAFLVFTGIKMWWAAGQEPDLGNNPALRWIERAAELDSVVAIDRLALAFRQGQLGLAPDTKRAEELEARSRSLRKIAPPKPARKPPPKSHG